MIIQIRKPDEIEADAPETEQEGEPSSVTQVTVQN